MKPSDPQNGPRERRRHPRYLLSEGVFAILKNHSERIGQVFDLSRGGVSFRYIADDGKKNTAERVDLFSARQKILVEKVPVRTVSDFVVEEDVPFSSVRLRHRSLQFLAVEPRTARQLDLLLRHHAVAAGS